MDTEIVQSARTCPNRPRVSDAEQVPDWHDRIRTRVLAELAEFLRDRHVEPVAGIALEPVLWQYAGRGKCVRSAFMYAGWLCGAGEHAAALRACAAMEWLHAFALLQDDVMDKSAERRGEPAAHLRFADQYRDRGLPGSATRFGESAATLLGDICLVWSEQMMRDSGVPTAALARVWPHYDRMRTELALGQFADLGNDIRARPSLDSVLAVARAKSGDYTVKWPLVMGATMAGCGELAAATLGEYGRLIGEAFQLRDDVLGVFGRCEITGKPGDSDIAQRKASTLIVAAVEMARPGEREELYSLLDAPELDAAAVRRVRALITASGAPARIEAMIGERADAARQVLAGATIPVRRRALLDALATRCTTRRL